MEYKILKKEKMYCSICDKEHEVELRESDSILEIKGEQIKYKEISPNVSLFRILLCHSGFLCYNGAKGKKAPGRSRPGFGRKRLCGKR